MRDSIKPTIRIQNTKSSISDQGYTYNQSGLTYNEIGVMYGGIYEHDIKPIISFAKSRVSSAIARQIIPHLKINNTNAQIANQGYTYNESGLTYNNIGVMYGGIYEHDIYPLVSFFRYIRPHINSAYNINETIYIPPTSGMLIGMLGLTYP